MRRLFLRQECGIALSTHKNLPLSSDAAAGDDDDDESEDDSANPIKIVDPKLRQRMHFTVSRLDKKVPAHEPLWKRCVLDKRRLNKLVNGLKSRRSWMLTHESGKHEPDDVLACAGRLVLQRMRMFHAVDFDEMLVRAHDLMSNNEEVLAIARQRFQYSLVDEFQDTSPVQMRLIQLMQRGRAWLMNVGDEAQGIYGWRGATNRAFFEFEADMQDTPVTTLPLEKNYRSVQPILEVSNNILAASMEAGDLTKKTLQCTRGGPHMPVFWHEFPLAQDEAEFQVEWMKRLHEAGMPWREMAVLVRCNKQRSLFPGSLGTLSRLKTLLLGASIPHRTYRGRTLMDSEEYKHMVAVLSLLCNPYSDGALVDVLQSSLKCRAGIGVRVIDSLLARQGALLAAREPTGEEDVSASLWSMLQELADAPSTGNRMRNPILKLIAWQKRVHHRVTFLPLPQALLYIFVESGISEAARKKVEKNAKAAAEEGAATADDAAGARSGACPTTPERLAARVQASTAPPATPTTDSAMPALPTETEALTSPMLETLHQLAVGFFESWTPYGNGQLADQRGNMQLDLASDGTVRSRPMCDEDTGLYEPATLMQQAAAAALSLPWRERVNVLQSPACIPAVRDKILSWNKLGYAPLLDWLADVALDAEEDEADPATPGAGDGEVILSTIHAVKGLEFDVVFFAKAMDRISPTRFNCGALSDVFTDVAVAKYAADQGLGTESTEDVRTLLQRWARASNIELSEEELDQRAGGGRSALRNLYEQKERKAHNEEELRLQHVATTRARKLLFITTHRLSESDKYIPFDSAKMALFASAVSKPFLRVCKRSDMPLPPAGNGVLVRHVRGESLAETGLRRLLQRDELQEYVEAYLDGDDRAAVEERIEGAPEEGLNDAAIVAAATNDLQQPAPPALPQQPVAQQQSAPAAVPAVAASPSQLSAVAHAQQVVQQQAALQHPPAFQFVGSGQQQVSGHNIAGAPLSADATGAVPPLRSASAISSSIDTSIMLRGDSTGFESSFRAGPSYGAGTCTAGPDPISRHVVACPQTTPRAKAEGVAAPGPSQRDGIASPHKRCRPAPPQSDTHADNPDAHGCSDGALPVARAGSWAPCQQQSNGATMAPPPAASEHSLQYVCSQSTASCMTPPRRQQNWVAPSIPSAALQSPSLDSQPRATQQVTLATSPATQQSPLDQRFAVTAGATQPAPAWPSGPHPGSAPVLHATMPPLQQTHGSSQAYMNLPPAPNPSQSQHLRPHPHSQVNAIAGTHHVVSAPWAHQQALAQTHMPTWQHPVAMRTSAQPYAPCTAQSRACPVPGRPYAPMAMLSSQSQHPSGSVIAASGCTPSVQLQHGAQVPVFACLPPGAAAVPYAPPSAAQPPFAAAQPPARPTQAYAGQLITGTRGANGDTAGLMQPFHAPARQKDEWQQ